MQLEGRGYHNGGFYLSGGSVLLLSNTQAISGHTFSVDSLVVLDDQASTFQVKAKNNYFYGTYNSSGLTVVSGGALYFVQPAQIGDFGQSVQVSGSGQLVLNTPLDDDLVIGAISVSGTAVFDASEYDISIGSLTLISGTIIKQGIITVDNSFVWNGGLLDGIGPLVSSTSLTVAGTSSMTVRSGMLLNLGMMTWRSGTINGVQNAILYNHANAIFNIALASAGVLSCPTFDSSLVNYGQIVQNTTVSSTIQFAFENHGSIAINAGSMTLSANGHFYEHSATGIAASSSLVFSGTLYTADGTIATVGTGFVNVAQGTLVVNGLLTGSLNVTSSSATLLHYGEMILERNSFKAGIVWISGHYNSTTPTVVQGSTVTFAFGSTIASFGPGLQASSGILQLYNNKLPQPMAPITISGSALVDFGSLDFSVPIVSLTAGTLSLTGTLSVTNQFQFDGGKLFTAFNGTIITTGQFTASGSQKTLDTVLLQLAGPASWTSGDFVGTNMSTLEILHGSNFSVSASNKLSTSTSAPSNLVIEGVLNKVSAGTTEIDFWVENNGRLSVQSSTLLIAGVGGWHTGTVDIAPTATLSLSTGSHTFFQQSLIINGGTLTISAGETFISGSLESDLITGFTTNIGGDLYIMPAANISTFGSSLTVTSGTTTLFANPQVAADVIVQGTAILDYTSLNVSLSTLQINGPSSVVIMDSMVTVWTSFTFYAGTVKGFGKLVSAGTLTFDGSSTKNINLLTVENVNTTRWIAGVVGLGDTAVLLNRNDALFSIEALNVISGMGQIINYGTMRKSMNVESTITVDITNSGVLDILANTLTFQGATAHYGTMTIAQSASCQIKSNVFVLEDSSQTSGAGVLLVNGGTAVISQYAYVNMLNSNISQVGSTQVKAGTLQTFAPSAVFGNPFSISAGTVIMYEDTKVDYLTVSSTGLLSGPARLTINKLATGKIKQQQQLCSKLLVV